jgi:hypothetical protein
MSHHHHHSDGCCSSHHHEDSHCHEEESCEAHHNHCEDSHHSCCSEHHQDSCSFGDTLLKLADEAWMNVLKGKIEKVIERQSGSQLDKVAELVSETNHKRWKGIIAKGHCKENFEKELGMLFGDQSCCQEKNPCSSEKGQDKGHCQDKGHTQFKK